MIYVVKEAFDIYVYYVVQIRSLHKMIAPCYCVFSTAVWSKTKRVFIELSFTYWLQDLLDTLLNNAVFDCGDAQGAHASI